MCWPRPFVKSRHYCTMSLNCMLKITPKLKVCSHLNSSTFEKFIVEFWPLSLHMQSSVCINAEFKIMSDWIVYQIGISYPKSRWLYWRFIHHSYLWHIWRIWIKWAIFSSSSFCWNLKSTRIFDFATTSDRVASSFSSLFSGS